MKFLRGGMPVPNIPDLGACKFNTRGIGRKSDILRELLVG